MSIFGSKLAGTINTTAINTHRRFNGAGPDSILLLITGVVDCRKQVIPKNRKLDAKNTPGHGGK